MRGTTPSLMNPIIREREDARTSSPLLLSGLVSLSLSLSLSIYSLDLLSVFDGKHDVYSRIHIRWVLRTLDNLGVYEIFIHVGGQYFFFLVLDKSEQILPVHVDKVRVSRST